MCTDSGGRATLRVRRATHADLDALSPLFDQYRQFYGQASDLERARAFLSERMRRRQSVILAAAEDTSDAESLLGFVQLYPSFTSVCTGRLWILNDLFVAPHARGQGVATILMEAARRHAERTQAARIELTTARDNVHARRLYEALGYSKDQHFITYRRAP